MEDRDHPTHQEEAPAIDVKLLVDQAQDEYDVVNELMDRSRNHLLRRSIFDKRNYTDMMVSHS